MPPSVISGVGQLTMFALYRQVKKQLIEDIRSGAAAPGAALPSESELARRFNVSIGTVRRAVDELVAEHILLRQQGRGTFVGKLDRERFMFQFFKISGRNGGSEFPEVRLHAFTRARATQEEAQALRLHGTQPVFCIDNVLLLKGRPVIHDHIVIACAMFSGLNRDLFLARSNTVYGLYQEAFGVTIVEADERVRAEIINPTSARLLNLAADIPALCIKRVAYTFDRTPAEFRTSIVDTTDVDYVSRMRNADMA